MYTHNLPTSLQKDGPKIENINEEPSIRPYSIYPGYVPFNPAAEEFNQNYIKQIIEDEKQDNSNDTNKHRREKR